MYVFLLLRLFLFSKLGKNEVAAAGRRGVGRRQGGDGTTRRGIGGGDATTEWRRRRGATAGRQWWR
jgi:hypothetical protein